MLDPRVYRAALIPALLAVVVVAFSLTDRPRPVGTTLAADAFDAQRAARGLQELAAAHPARRPGGAGEEDLAAEVAAGFRAAGFAVRSTHATGDTIEGERTLTNVIAERPGTLDERLVVVAHRDAAGRGAAAELSGTAALLELARVYGAPRRTRRTLTLVSTSGGSGGSAGAARLVGELGDRVGAVLVLGDLASAAGEQRPFVVPWSNGGGLAPLQLRRTVEAAVRAETGLDPGQPRALAQIARLAFPFTTGGQGPLVEAGWPAVTLSVRGERAPPADAEVSSRRLGAFGRTALRTITALDNGPSVAAPPTGDVLTARKVLPGWTVRLLAGLLLLPVLLMLVDGFARARRRREPVGRWVAWTLACAAPFALAALFAVALGTTGLLPATPPAPVEPEALPAGDVAAVALGAVALVFLLGWLVLRPLLLRLTGAGGGDPRAPGASLGVLLVLAGGAVVVWAANPYAALVVLPALHLWLIAVSPEIRLPRAAALGLLVAGLLPAAALGVYVAAELGVGIAGVPWTALLLVAGGHVSVPAALLWSVVAGCAAGAALIALRPHAERPGEQAGGRAQVPMRTLGYAGPGSLGGTESALRR